MFYAEHALRVSLAGGGVLAVGLATGPFACLLQGRKGPRRRFLHMRGGAHV